ncbi:hypothetical protein H5A33_11780 [Pectobacterium brasiliense]|uniref:hypothetical protein n=1 Tax=Pectobacterium TaxID=122277 RepID=UPI00057D91A7|nr:hypothetical protein [Pectobacterium brasiliense]KHT42889.1 hypothetical protein RD02_05085 [Pectobacterium brasiliense]MBN3255307.1 hypothetical protein [Pectobacterium brasiliense]
MGKTDSIKDKEKRDQEFRAFMAKIEAESKLEEETLYNEIQSSVQRHYDKNKWDHSRLFGDRRSDYQNYSDWGLERVNAIIESIGKALCSSSYPSSEVPGSDKADPKAIEEAKKTAGIFAGDYSLILARVQALISGALSQFSVKSNATRKSELRDLPLSGGLHLFFASSGKVYESTKFFSNQMIGSFQIVFETYMSEDEARTIGIIKILQTTEFEIQILNGLIEELRIEQAKSLKEIMKTDIKQYVTTKEAYNEALDSVKADRDKVMLQYDQYKKVIGTVDKLYDQLELSEFGQLNKGTELFTIDNLFTPWEAQLATRYIKEKLAV